MIRLAPEAAPPRLTWRLPSGAEHSLDLRGPTTIGAADSNTITLGDPAVAGFHAVVRPAEGGWLLEDLGTGASTLVNSLVVRTKRLVDHDWLQFGRTQLHFLDTLRLPVSLSELFGSEDRLAEKDCRALSTESSVPDSLRGIYQAAANLASVTSEPRLLEELCRTAGTLFAADRAAVFCLYGPISDRPPLPLRLDASWLKQGVSGEASGEFRVSSTLLRRVLATDGPFLVKNLPDEPLGGSAGSVLESHTRSVLAAVLLCRGTILGVLYADRTRNETPFSTEEQALFGALAVVAATTQTSNRQTQRQEQELLTRAQLARYLPGPLVDEVASRKLAWEPGGQIRPVTAILVSLRPAAGFSQLAPQETVTALNDCLWLIVQEIFKGGGTLDRFLVMALTAVWGNPEKRPTDAVTAVQSALAIRRAVDSFNRTRRATGLPEISIAVAVSTGAAIACGLGIPSRMDYTVLGQPVNWVANAEAYLENGQVLMDEQTFSRIQGKVPVRPASVTFGPDARTRERTYEAVPEEPPKRGRVQPPRRVACHGGDGPRPVPALIIEAGDGEVSLTVKPGELPSGTVGVALGPGQAPLPGRVTARQTQRDVANRDVELITVAFSPEDWTPLAEWLRGT